MAMPVAGGWATSGDSRAVDNETPSVGVGLAAAGDPTAAGDLTALVDEAGSQTGVPAGPTRKGWGGATEAATVINSAAGQGCLLGARGETAGVGDGRQHPRGGGRG